MRFQVLFAHPSGHLCRVIVEHAAPNQFQWLGKVRTIAYIELAAAQCRSVDDVMLDTLCLAALGDDPRFTWLNPDGIR